MQSPNVGTLYNDLNGVAAISSSDVWAVGNYFTDYNSPTRTLTEHWNGSVWSLVQSPNVGNGIDTLSGIAAVSASDIWAVGYYSIGSYQGNPTLVEHWNGSSWSVVPSPSMNRYYNYLNGVAVVSANDVWAVGYYYDRTVNQTLVERWDGALGTSSQASTPIHPTPT